MTQSAPADPAQRRFLFLLGSTRREGNSELLARRAAEHLPAGAEQRWLRLADLPVPTFVDQRHDGGHPEPTGNLRTLLDATLDATDLVVVSPLYWYSVTTGVKQYLDHWSGWLRLPEADFKRRMAGRTMWAVTAMADRDPARAEPLAGTLRISADYLAMRWGGVLLGNGSRPGDVLTDTDALRRAETFFTADAPEAARPAPAWATV
ncbi:NAD(P)H-dependent oxidoreductase [Kitasatospora paracochleata]|uniref:Multimeric flavodoxin WrbA n=1 Tax=Kitasatospora paracochleata TaxID=58354 RepID=A0ABT1J7D8_9ACTN|nr:NAD(P)H-dependent oxidoreductase [Kitasatospora paracochleata]MCP2313033.1 multimeric flavodoxin WrbA [Kitasatospora paracochleata]